MERSAKDKRCDLVTNMGIDGWIFHDKHKLQSIVKLNILINGL